MATSGDTTERSKYAKPNLLTGELPDDFLRISGDAAPSNGQIQYPAFNGFQTTGGLLTITVVQARLAKNYGVTRMDPYCKLRVGVQVFETPTAYNGAKTPRWNKLIQCHIPEQVKEIYLEIYDERTFSIDERVAWGLLRIKDEVFNGETVDEWFPLNGKQGDEKEGMIQIGLSYRKSQGTPVLMGGPMMMNPMGGTQLVYGYPPMMYAPPMMIPQMQMTQQQQQQQQLLQQQQMQQQQIQQQQQQQQLNALNEVNEKDLKALKEMCPTLDDEIIKTVLQQSGGNVDRAAAQLLEMSSS